MLNYLGPDSGGNAFTSYTRIPNWVQFVTEKSDVELGELGGAVSVNRKGLAALSTTAMQLDSYDQASLEFATNLQSTMRLQFVGHTEALTHSFNLTVMKPPAPVVSSYSGEGEDDVLDLDVSLSQGQAQLASSPSAAAALVTTKSKQHPQPHQPLISRLRQSLAEPNSDGSTDPPYHIPVWTQEGAIIGLEGGTQ